MKQKDSKHNLKKIIQNLPKDFLNLKQFCLWRYETRKNSDKPSKVPYYIYKSKVVKANIKDFTKWVTGVEAIKIAESHAKDFFGIGFIITHTNFFGLDLDNCVNNKTRQLLPWAQTIVNYFDQTYIEISPSGEGIRIIGQGNTNIDRNKSPLNSLLEVYDGNSIRYLTITGEKFGKSTIIYNYKKNEQPLLWLQKTFFPSGILSDQQTTKKKLHKKTKPNKNLENRDVEQEFFITKKIIETSKDAKLFFRYQSSYLINHKSTSEDDWHFCLLILRYMREGTPELLQEFLLRCRNRNKLKRKDYINLTIQKVIQKAQKDNLIGKDYSPLVSPISNPITYKKQKLHTIKKQHILKYCNMLDIFTVREQFYSGTQEVIIKKDDHNWIKVYTQNSLSGVDLDNYLGILQIANLNLYNETIIDSEAKGDLLNTVKVRLNLYKLSKILHKKDGGKFRKDVLRTIRKMSRLYFEYQKVIDKEGNYVEGGSNLLSWYGERDYLHNVKRITLGINPFAWYIMKNGRYNYCLINTHERFKLPTLQLRLIYFYLCRKVVPGLHNFCTFDIEHLSKVLWGITTNKHTNKTRKRSIRQICQVLYQLQSGLTDFEIILIQDKSIIQAIGVKRHRVLVVDS